MKFRSKNSETMFWVEKYKTMVSFKNGIAEVDDKIGKEMIQCGYRPDGNDTVSEPKTIIAKEHKKVDEDTKKEESTEKSIAQPKFKN